jgi:hypothetical protein
MAVAPAADERLKLAYQEAERAVTQQLALLDGLRTRAATLFGAANIATSFLAGVALKNQSLKPQSWVGLAMFVVVALLTVAILWPRSNWSFELSGRKLVEYAHPKNYSLDEIYKKLAGYMERDYDQNQKRMDLMFLLFDIAAGALAIEIVAWVIDLARGPR